MYGKPCVCRGEGVCRHLLAGVGPVEVEEAVTRRPLEAVSLLVSPSPDVLNVVCGRRTVLMGREEQAGQVRLYQRVAV